MKRYYFTSRIPLIYFKWLIIRALAGEFNFGDSPFDNVDKDYFDLCCSQLNDIIYHFIAVFPKLSAERVEWLKNVQLTGEDMKTCNGTDWFSLSNFCVLMADVNSSQQGD